MAAAKLSFGFLGGLITREGDAGFDEPAALSLGYCPACRRNKPGAFNDIIEKFVCLKCGYPLEESKRVFNIKRKYEGSLHSTSY